MALSTVPSRPVTRKHKNLGEVEESLRKRTVRPSRPFPRPRGLRRPKRRST